MANVQNLKPQPFTSETGRKAQKKSVAKRKENQTARETARAILSQVITDEEQLKEIREAKLPVGENPTYLDYMVASIIMRSVQKGSMEDLLKLMDVLGEDRGDVAPANLKKAEELLGNVQSVID